MWNVHVGEPSGLQKQLKAGESREGAMVFTTNLSGLMDLLTLCWYYLHKNIFFREKGWIDTKNQIKQCMFLFKNYYHY